MSVKIILSNTFGFSADNMYRLIAKNAEDGKKIVIVPDKFSLAFERNILKKLGITSTFDVDVTSFMRLAVKTLRKKNQKCLTPEGSVMLLKRAIDEVKDKLTVYKEVDDVAFPREMYAVITALRNSGINAEDTASVDDKKLKDVGIIYEKYLDVLNKSFIDSTSRLEAFSDEIGDDFSSADVYIFGFPDFTATQYEIIFRLFVHARNVTVGLIAPADDAKNKRIYPSRPVKKLCSYLDDAKIKYDVSHADVALNPVKKQLSDLFSYAGLPPVETNGKVEIVEAKNITDEVEYIAKNIRRNVIENGLRYNDFAVVVPSSDDYENDVKNVFERLRLPYFLDKKIPFSSAPQARYILSAIKCVADGFDFDDVNSLIKNPLFYKSRDGYESVQYFENYVLKNALTNKINKKFNDEEAEKIRKRIFSVTAPFMGLDGESTEKYASALFKFLENENVQEFSEGVFDAVKTVEGKASTQFYDKFIDIVAEMQVVLKDTSFSLFEFSETLKGVFENVKVALVPMYLDSVYVGRINESFFDGIKIAYVAGAVEGLVPKAVANTAVLGVKEEESLIKKGLDIYPSKRDSVKNNAFELTSFLIKPDKVVVTYPLNYKGTESRASSFVTSLSQYFTVDKKPLVPTKTDKKRARTKDEEILDYAFDTATYENGKYKLLLAKSLKSAKQKENAGSFFGLLSDDDKAYVQKLLSAPGEQEKVKINLSLERGVFSASQLETYFACPYKQFMRYGLRLKPREEGVLRTLETGTLMHAVMEKFVKEKVYENPTDENIQSVCDRAVKEQLALPEFKQFDTAKNKLSFERIKKEGAKICKEISAQIQKSDFKPYLAEAKIGKEGEATLHGMKIEKDGNEYVLVGSIDRIDAYKDYFSVIDYKSFEKKLSVKDIFSGEKIQPVLYMGAVNNGKLKYPVGLLYQPVSVGYKSKGKNRFKMSGFIINDAEILKNMDNTLDAGVKSEFLPVSLKGDGTATKRANVVSDTAFTAFQRYVEKLSEKAINEILDGNIAPSPIEHACKFCDFKDICPCEGDERIVRAGFPAVSSPDDLLTLANGGELQSRIAEENDDD